MVTGHWGSGCSTEPWKWHVVDPRDCHTPGFITTNISSLCFVITVDSVDPWDWDTSTLGICYKPLQLKCPLTIRWCGFISTENDRHYPALICLYTLWLQWKANGQVVDERDCHTSTLLWLHRKPYTLQLKWADHTEMFPSFSVVLSVYAFVAN